MEFTCFVPVTISRMTKLKNKIKVTTDLIVLRFSAQSPTNFSQKFVRLISLNQNKRFSESMKTLDLKH